MKGKIALNTSSFSVKNTQKDKHEHIVLDDILGQTSAKRALTIAVAGRHNILFTGPPGTGKTLLAKASASLLPSPSLDEQIAITKLHSLNTLCTQIITERPYRAPHHSASLAALLGGGPNLIPGEISLAHLGILHLDELLEFPRDRIEALRQPLESHSITLSRLGHHISYPADFMLIATTNPCPCGYYGSDTNTCTCTPSALYNYRRKLSGPLLDRIDIAVELRCEQNTLPQSHPDGIPEQSMAEKLIKGAQAQQFKRYHDPTKFNGRLSSSEVIGFCQLSTPARHLLDEASKRYQLSARSFFKIIKLAQTIADLTATQEIAPEHIAEAIQYRPHFAP